MMISRRKIIKTNQQVDYQEEDQTRLRILKTKQQQLTNGEMEFKSARQVYQDNIDELDRMNRYFESGDTKKTKKKKKPSVEQMNMNFHENLLDDALSLDDDERELNDNDSREISHQVTPRRSAMPAASRPSKASKLITSKQAQDDLEEEDEEDDHFRHQDQEEPSERMLFQDELQDDSRIDFYRNFDPYSVYGEEDEEEDVWYSEERLFEDHLKEIVDKWHSIDDEIWAKIICMERNRRIAKAYARKHTISIDGGTDDYLDGTTLGLNSFENPDRDSKTSYIKRYIGEGIKIKMHQNGDILVKRLSRSSVFVHPSRPARAAVKSSNSTSDMYALTSSEGPTSGLGEFYGLAGLNSEPNHLRRRDKFLSPAPQAKSSTQAAPKASSSSSGASSSQSPAPAKSNSKQLGPAVMQLQLDKVVRLFSMDKFKSALEFESRKTIPNRARLQNMCISILSFVVSDQKILNLPSWIMIVNIVALDLLSSEIGLSDPYDLLPPPLPMDEHHPHQSRSRLRANKSFNCLENYELEDEESQGVEEHPYRKFNGFSSRSKLPLKTKKTFPLQESSQMLFSRSPSSKGALASSDTRDYYRLGRSDDMAPGYGYEFRQKLAAGGQPNTRPNNNQQKTKESAKLTTTKEINSDGELQNAAKKKVSERPTRAIEQLLGSSSSSGFNSHCSYQHDDSSANSSSSNIASNGGGSAASNKENNLGTKKDRPSRFRLFRQDNKPKKEALTTNGDNEKPNNQDQQPARGKRPPKLPHGISNKKQAEQLDDTSINTSDNEPVIMSEPIPIPPIPTSGGGPPSGKANLILVSPTGLSPPTTKKLHLAGQLASEAANNNVTTNDLIQQAKGKQTLKLPTGIPSHAQLAPPATRKHILRYLMSTTRPKTGARRLCQEPLPPPPPRIHRPLPGLPPGCHQHQRSDESLYYSGLQARIPNYRLADGLPPRPSRHEPPSGYTRQLGHMPPAITKSAIDSILSDFKQNVHFRQQLQQQLTSQAQLLLANGAVRVSNQQHRQDVVGDEERRLRVAKHLRSLDDLHMATAASSSSSGSSLSNLLNHVGGFLKRQPKPKRSLVVE